MQFSLKDLLLVVAFCAGIAFCAAVVGFDNIKFWIVLGVAVFMSSVFVRYARTTRPLRVLLITIPALLLSFMLLVLALFADALLLTIVAIFLARKPVYDTKSLVIAAAVCMLVSTFIGTSLGMGVAGRYERARKEFPIVSLKDRLKYEHPESKLASASITMSSSVAKQLEANERLEDYDWRQRQLQMLHNHEYELFVRAIGFGIGRMAPMNPDSIRRPEIRDIQFDESTPFYREPWQNYWRALIFADKVKDASSAHFLIEGDFLDPDGFGLVMDGVQKVAGFISHAFHYSPKSAFEKPDEWTIERLELVSLLKFDTPRVYVLDHLPRMDQLNGDNVPTRALDAFEKPALEKLWTEEDVVVKQDGNHYRMLGSLRAGKQCMDCHTVERGELLGAFSYALTQYVVKPEE